MEDKQYIQQLLEVAGKYEIDKYRDVNKDSYTAFEGTPKKHPHDNNVLILFTSPFSEDKKFYEFTMESIGTIEDLGTVSSTDGQNVNKIRVWVKKGVPALKSEPFIVK